MASIHGELDVAVLIQILVWTIAGFWIVIRLLRREPDGRLAAAVPHLGMAHLLGILLAFLLALSAVNSPAPAVSLFRAFQLGVACVFSAVFVSRYGSVRAHGLLYCGLTLVMWLVYATFFLDPNLVLRSGRYFGIRGDAVAPAAPLALSLVMLTLIEGRLGIVSRVVSGVHEGRCAAVIRVRWVRCLVARLVSVTLHPRVVMVAALALLVLARSRTGFIALGLCMVIALRTLLRRQSLAWRFVVPLLALLVVGGFAVGWEVVAGWFVRNPEQLSRLSARIPLWTGLVMGFLRDAPFLGYGFVAGTRVAAIDIVSALGNAHSSFVEVLAGSGILAAGCYLAVWILVAVAAVQGLIRGTDWDLLHVSLVGIVFLFALTTSYAVLPSVVSFVFWLTVATWPNPPWAVTRGTAPLPQATRPPT